MVALQYFVFRDRETNKYLAMALNDGDPTGRGETIDEAIEGAKRTFESLCLAIDETGGNVNNCFNASYLSFEELVRRAISVNPELSLLDVPRKERFTPSEGRSLFPENLQFEFYLEKRV